MAQDVTALREQIDARLPRVADELQGLVRNSIRLKTRKAKNEASPPIGTSKLGGLPDLPEDAEWPEWNGEPLAFIAQINLEEAAPYDLEHLLPMTGMLYFFYDARLETWGDRSEDRGGARVLYFAGDVAGIRQTPFPETLHEWGRDYPACAVQLTSEAHLPVSDSMYISDLDLTEEEVAQYDALLEWLEGPDEEYTDHRLLGYSRGIQG
ncbi:MAG: YwqG family protein, partial [Chloroflexota bacterium]|nr:YwqG family protein [Chloroflexota bacterium]